MTHSLESKGSTIHLLKAKTKPIGERKKRKVYDLPEYPRSSSSQQQSYGTQNQSTTDQSKKGNSQQWSTSDQSKKDTAQQQSSNDQPKMNAGSKPFVFKAAEETKDPETKPMGDETMWEDANKNVRY